MPARRYKPRSGYRTRRRGYNRRALQSRFRQRRYRRTRKGYLRRKFPIGGFPNSRTVTLRYVEDFSLNPGASPSLSTQVFRINNLDDPNYTGVGHQPMYYDNYKAIYTKYRVNYATITFVCMDNHVVNVKDGGTESYAGQQKCVRMFIIRDNETGDYTSGNGIDTLIEEGSTNLRWKFAPQTTSSGLHKLTMRAYPRMLFKVPYNDSGLQATTTAGAQPLNECYFVCGVDSFPNSDAQIMNYQAIITYNVTFFDLNKAQPQN